MDLTSGGNEKQKRHLHTCINYFRPWDQQEGTKKSFWFYSSLSFLFKSPFFFLTKESRSVFTRYCFSDVATIAIVSLWVGYYWAEYNEARISMSISFWGGLITCPPLNEYPCKRSVVTLGQLTEKESHRKMVSARAKNMAVGF